MIECPRCGHMNRAGAKNCWECGLALKTVKPELGGLDSLEITGAALNTLGSAWMRLTVLIIVVAVLIICLIVVFR